MREKILFVCIENACRSQLAEAICNNLFSDQLIAYSAGSKPVTEVNPKAIKSLKSIGIIHRGENKSISEFLDMELDYVVGMGCGDKCPIIPGSKILNWDIPDPKQYAQKDFNKIGKEIFDAFVLMPNEIQRVGLDESQARRMQNQFSQ